MLMIERHDEPVPYLDVIFCAHHEYKQIFSTRDNVQAYRNSLYQALCTFHYPLCIQCRIVDGALKVETNEHDKIVSKEFFIDSGGVETLRAQWTAPGKNPGDPVMYTDLVEHERPITLVSPNETGPFLSPLSRLDTDDDDDWM